MTGQTIGVFRSRADRRLAKQALKPVRAITLRDHGRSEADVRALGVRASRVQSTHDDALFCGTAPAEAVAAAVRQAGLDPDMPFIAANFHYWGLSSSRKRLRSVCSIATIWECVKRPGLVCADGAGRQQPERDVMARMHCRTAMLNMPMTTVGPNPWRRLACVHDEDHPIIFAYGKGFRRRRGAGSLLFPKNRGAMELFGQEAYCRMRVCLLKKLLPC